MCNELPEASKLSPDGTERHHEHGVACSAHRIKLRPSTQRCLVVTFSEVLYEVSYLR